MKAVLFLMVATIVVAQCNHMFLGSNVNRPMVHHQDIQKGAQVFRKTIGYFNYQLPSKPFGPPRAIQGILAVDRQGSEASVNVTSGGIGYQHVGLRMKSERGRGLKYDIYIYV